MKNVFFFILIAVVSATITKCGFNPKDYKVEVVPLKKSKTVKADQTFETIRFYKYLFDMPTIYNKVDKTVVESIADSVLNKISSFLKVHRTTQNIEVPANALDKTDYSVPEDHTTPGLADTDYVVYFIEKNCKSIASAGPRMIDNDHRPYVGLVNLCIDYAESMKTDREYYEVVVLHEMMHALGFGTQFEEFPDMMVDTKVKEETFKQIQSAKVVDAVKKHFGCDSMTGALLENDGGAGTANAHWERTIYNGELMTGWISSAEPNVLSNITLSWLEDTGLYEVDYSAAKDFSFGKNKGCEMTQLKCTDNNNNPIGDFCDARIEDQCSFNYRGEGYCKANKTFGLDCPVRTMYGNALCSDTSRINPQDYILGKYYGTNGFCQNNDGFISNKYKDFDSTQMCARIQCPPSTPNEYQVVICPLEAGCNNDNDYKIGTCKNDGEKITVDGYKGEIICGKREYVCSEENGYDKNAKIITPSTDPSGTTAPPITSSPSTTTKPDGGDDGDDHTSKDDPSDDESNIFMICNILLLIAVVLF